MRVATNRRKILIFLAWGGKTRIARFHPDSTSVEGPSEVSDVEKESDDQFILRYTSELKDATKFLANRILSIFDRLGRSVHAGC
eukprot:930818-Amorphochlora_amoeboformis.AAC.1